MNILVKRLLAGASATAVIVGAAMTASAQPAAELDIEEVNVSSSRISLQGFESPTPVQVVGIERIELNARTQISDEIRDLPQVKGTVGSRSGTNRVGQGDGGIDSLNLRGFGANRNLVLFDRQRMVSSTIQSSVVDLGTVPSALVQRVDVVTGGASAAWGSDAVTGVVNLVINKNFTGFKANVQYSDASPVALPRYHLDAAWGTPFDGGKGHFAIAGTWNVSNTPNFVGQDPKRNGRTNVYNPAYCNAVTYPAATPTSNGVCTSKSGVPFLMYVFNGGQNDRTVGGLVNQNSAGTAGSGLTANNLKGIMFNGLDGSPTNFNYGTTFNGTTCYNGCSNNQYTNQAQAFTLTEAPYHSANYFSYASYQILPDVKASVQLAYGRYVQRNKGNILQVNNQTFYADNAYLDPAIARRFTCAGTASASCVTTLSNGYNPNTGTGGTAARPTQTMTVGMEFGQNRLAYNPTNTFGNVLPGQSANNNVWTMANLCSGLGDSCNYSNRTLARGSFQLDGALGDAWAWSSYIGWSQMRLSQKLPNDLIRPRLAYAIDAVRVTATNVGASGLPIGSIQCRALLTPANLTADPLHLPGCQPINVFGSGNVTNEAYRYVSPGIDYAGTGILEREVVKMNQTAAAFTLNGVLPWTLPAGEIGVALGAEWRLEQAGQYEADPIGWAYGTSSNFNTGNFYNFSAQHHVEEGFMEIAVPVLKDTIVENFDLNLSGRMTNYSTSGLVETWKVGISSQITQDFRIRGFVSQDIRAPTNFDLFAPGGGASGNCEGWVAGTGSAFCTGYSGGNPNLNPEKANTVALGVVFTPTFIPGLSASVDWYDLRLHGAIGSAGNVITRAKKGETQYCSRIITSTGADICSFSQAPGTPNVPAIIGTINTPINVGRQTVAGFDATVDYRFDLFGGEASAGFAGSYTYDYSQFLFDTYFQGAGATGGFYSGGVKFNGQVNLGYRTGPWNFGLQVHLSGDGDRDFGTQGGRTGLLDTLSLVRYTRVNGVDVPTVPSGGQCGEGCLPTNYQSWLADLGGRIQYAVDDNITLYGAMDRIFPGNKTYRMGVRFNY